MGAFTWRPPLQGRRDDLIASRNPGFLHLNNVLSSCSPANAQAQIGSELYGNSTSDFYLDDVDCRGEEATILNCPATVGAENHNCDSTEPASVSCLPDLPTPAPGIVQLNYYCSKELTLITARGYSAN